MSKNLQHFVNNFVLGMGLGRQFMQDREMSQHRKEQIAVAREKAKADAAYRTDKMGLEGRRVSAIEKGTDARAARDYAAAAKAGQGKPGKAPMTPEQEEWYTRNGITPTPPPPSLNITTGSSDSGGTVDYGGSLLEDAEGGRIPKMARGGRAFGGAMQTGMMVGGMANRLRGKDQWGRPINPDPRQAPGTSGPGSGMGAIATRPPTYEPDVMGGTGDAFRRGGSVRRFADGGSADETRVPPYERPYWSRDAYPWQGPDPATGRQPDEYVPDRRYPSTPPMNRDQSPDRYYRPDPSQPGRVAVQDFVTRGPVSQDVPVRQSEFPYVYPPNNYQGPMAPEHDPRAAYPARPIAPARTAGGGGGERARPRGGADPSAIETGPGFMDARLRGGAAADAGLAEEPPGVSRKEFGSNDSPDQYYQDDPRTKGGTRAIPGAPGRSSAPPFIGEEDRAVEGGNRPRPNLPATSYDPSDYEGGPARTTQTMPPTVVQGSAGADRLGGGAGAGRGGAGAGGGSRGAISTGWKPLRDQSRTAAFDPKERDRFDPDNVHAVDQKGAALAGATGYADRVFHQGNQQGKIQGQQTGGEGAPMDPRSVRGKHALYNGTGAADPKLMEQIFQKVDPENRMSMDQKMMAAVKNVHAFYTAQGDTENANKSAFEVSQFAVQMSKQHGAEAIKLMQAGNQQAGLDMLIKGYNMLPDGNTASVQNGRIVITSEAGQPVASYALDEKGIQNIALGMASGQLGWDVIRMGGQGGAAPPGAAGPAPAGAAQPAAAPAGPFAQPPAATPSVRSAGPPAGAPAPEAGANGSTTAVGRPATAPNLVPQAPAGPSQNPPNVPRSNSAAPPRPPLTHDGLPARQNADGSHSTELSITVTNPRLNGGRPTNIPSLWGGREVGEDEAVDNALNSGKPYQSFNSIPEAVKAAEAKSAAGGANAPASSPPPAKPQAGPTPGVPAQGDAPGKQGVQTKPPFGSAQGGASGDRKSPSKRVVEDDPKKQLADHFKDDPYKPLPAEGTVTEGGQRHNADQIRKELQDLQAQHDADRAREVVIARKKGIPLADIHLMLDKKDKRFEEVKKRAEKLIDEERTADRERRKEERANLKPRSHTTQDLTDATRQFDARRIELSGLATRDARGKAGDADFEDAAKAKRDQDRSVLRFMQSTEDKKALNRAAIAIWRHNDGMLPEDALDAAVAATRIIPSGKSRSNEQSGAGAIEYRPIKNFSNGVMLEFSDGRRVQIDSNGYSEIKALHRKNWEDFTTNKGKETDRKKKVETGYEGAIDLLKPFAPTGGAATSGR